MDNRALRGGAFNGHAKWIVSAVGTGILAAIWFLAVADRDGFLAGTATAQARADSAYALAAESDKQIAVIRSEMAGMASSIDEIRKDKREILSRLPKR